MQPIHIKISTLRPFSLHSFNIFFPYNSISIELCLIVYIHVMVDICIDRLDKLKYSYVKSVDSHFAAVLFRSSTRSLHTFIFIWSSSHGTKMHVYSYNIAQLPLARPDVINSFDRVRLESVYTAILLGSSTHRKRIAVLFAGPSWSRTGIVRQQEVLKSMLYLPYRGATPLWFYFVPLSLISIFLHVSHALKFLVGFCQHVFVDITIKL